MEAMAREMLASDENLRDLFYREVEEDSTIAADPWAVLNWFYRRTPYWDDRKDVYPVGRLFDRGVVDRLSAP